MVSYKKLLRRSIKNKVTRDLALNAHFIVFRFNHVWYFPFFSCRQLLCPALIQLLGSPLTDLNKRPKTVTQFPEEINRGGRGTGNFAKSTSIVGPIPRTIYNIATELLRLVGPLAAMRPVLESLFHRIILYPPAQQRTEALKALKEVQWIDWSASLFSW